MPDSVRTGRSRMKQTPTGRLVLQVETHTTTLVPVSQAVSLDQLGARTVQRWQDAGPADLRALAAGELEPPLWIVPSRIRALVPRIGLAALGAVATNLTVAGLAFLGAQMALPEPGNFLAAALSPQALGLGLGGAIATFTLVRPRKAPAMPRA
mgnify:CR=1 FL=1